MATIADLTATDNMDAAKRSFLTDLREHTTSIQTYINDSIKDNVQQLALDAFPSGYAFDADGAKNYTGFDLFDKQTIVDSYTGGDFTISTTGAWTDLDATNAAIAFTPVLLAGDFKVMFQFCVNAVTTNATNEVNVRFRLTDGSENSTCLPNIHMVTGVTATTYTIPITLMHEFDALSASAKTVKLQYYITTKTNVTLKVLASTTVPIYMQVEKI